MNEKEQRRKIGRINMLPKYMAWTVQGKKCATTRLSCKPPGLYWIYTRTGRKIVNTAVLIEVTNSHEWTMNGVSEQALERFAADEHFKCGKELLDVLIKLNANRRDGCVLGGNTPLFTHYYRVVQVPIKLDHLYNGGVGNGMQKPRSRKIKTEAGRSNRSA